jgi:hypothetical protein
MLPQRTAMAAHRRFLDRETWEGSVSPFVGDRQGGDDNRDGLHPAGTLVKGIASRQTE